MNYKTYILIAATLLCVVQSYAVFSSQDTYGNAAIWVDTAKDRSAQIPFFIDNAKPSSALEEAVRQVRHPSAADMQPGRFALIELCQETRQSTAAAEPDLNRAPASQLYIHHYVVQSRPQNGHWSEIEMPRYPEITGNYGPATPVDSSLTFSSPDTLARGNGMPADSVSALESRPVASPHHRASPHVIHIPEGVDASILIDSDAPQDACYILRLALNTALP